jgi:tetratricopeptide (TPR) repeat protein
MRFAVSVVSPPSNPTVGGAFHEVAESLHYALVALGHDSVLTKRLDLHDRRTIVLGANHLIHYGLEIPTDPVFYNLEQLGVDSPWMRMPEFVDLFRRYPAWDYSQTNVERIAALGLPRPTFVPIGYVPELTRIEPVTEDVDVLFYGVLSRRRYGILRDLHERGVRVKWLSGVIGARRDAWIARSKIVLNLHYWEAKIFEIVRVSYLLANKRTVLSETGADPALERGLGSGVAFADYHELVDRCMELLGDERARRELAERGYELIAARSQADIVRRALSEGPISIAAPETAVSERSRADAPPQGRGRSVDHEIHNRNLLRHKSEQERDQLLADVERDPQDARSVLFLAQTYLQLGEFFRARTWFARRVEMGGCDEEVYWAMYRLAQAMQQLDEPWQDVEDAYLRAWIFRPTRAEPLLAIATAYRKQRRFRLGYLFAQRAAEVPFPEADLLLPSEFSEVYTWRATDEQAVCASWIGEHAKAFALCRHLLTRSDLSEEDRQRIATNRDYSVPAMIEAASPYPEIQMQTLTSNHHRGDVTVTLITGPHRHTTEDTLNTFLNCCLDLPRIERFLVLDTGLSSADRALLRQQYGFLEFADSTANSTPAAQLAQLRTHIDTRHWLHLGHGWRFFAPEHYLTRLTAVLDTEPLVFQVGINYGEATTLIGTCAPEHATRRTPDGGRYLMTNAMTRGPALYDTARLDRAIAAQQPADRTAPRTATLDEMLCVKAT